MSVRCIACGRVLKSPDSVRRRYGPECWKKVQHATTEIRNGEPVTVVDEDLAERTLGSLRKVVRRTLSASSGRTQCTCGEVLYPFPIEHCNHPGGYHLPGFGKPQWAWLHCDSCGHDMSLGKLGVTQELVDAELDRDRRYKEPDPGQEIFSQ